MSLNKQQQSFDDNYFSCVNDAVKPKNSKLSYNQTT